MGPGPPEIALELGELGMAAAQLPPARATRAIAGRLAILADSSLEITKQASELQESRLQVELVGLMVGYIGQGVRGDRHMQFSIGMDVGSVLRMLCTLQRCMGVINCDWKRASCN